MLNKEITIAAARGCIGTPFHHQGRQKGAGLDCIGLVIHALSEGGMDIADNLDYGRSPQAGKLEEALLAHGFFEVTEQQAGDVLLFRILRSPQHVGLAATESRFVHAYAPLGRVIETELGPLWQRRLCGIYRYGG